MLGRLSLRARLAPRRDRDRRGRPRRRGRRNLPGAQLVPPRPGREHAQRRPPGRRGGALPAARAPAPGRVATSGRSSTRSPATASRCGKRTRRSLRRTCIREFGDSTPAPGPKLPATVTLPTSANTPDGDRVTFFTVPALSGGGSYRVRASVEPSAPNRILLIAAPLADVNSTLHRLLLIELARHRCGAAGHDGARRSGSCASGCAHSMRSGRPRRRSRRATSRSASSAQRIAPRSAGSGWRSTRCSRRSRRRVTALEASEAKLRRFVADASHELRTPLAAVRAYAELFTPRRRRPPRRPRALDEGDQP